MSFKITAVEDHLIGMGHSSTLKKVRNEYAMFERTAGRFLLHMKPLEVIRKTGLSGPVYDDIYDYALPDDFGALIDLAPQDNRTSWDQAFRRPDGQFDREKAIRNRTIDLTGREGLKKIRINWRTRQGKVLNSMNSYNGNGTWVAAGTTSAIATDTIFKVNGGGSVKFTLNASGDGIQNTSMTAVNLTTESQVGDVFVWVYLPSTAVTGATAIWGNDLTTKFWTAPVVTTQADGSALRAGWNLLKFSWASAVQTGTVDPTTIDSFKITFTTSSTPVLNVRVDNIVFTIGRNFDIEYYSKYLFQLNSTSAWASRPTSGDDLVMLDNDSLAPFLMELLKDMAQQMEGTDSAFDIGYAEKELAKLYPAYKTAYPNMMKKSAGNYGGLPFRGSRHKRYGR